MKSPMLVLGLLIAVGFVWGVLHLFGLEFAKGDVYPAYSSLRSDPAGAKLLYDSLGRMQGIEASRNYLPLVAARVKGASIILLGLEPKALAEQAESLKKIAERGNRVVAAMEQQAEVDANVLEETWQVRLLNDSDVRRLHRVSFAESAGWTVIERIGVKILAIERSFGDGSVVLLTESDDFTNESTVAADRLDVVTAALGDHAQIIFDENHLGIAESGSVVSLARQFRLSGLALGLAICAALWIWRASYAFPPPRAGNDERSLAGRPSHSGLLTLLRRNIPARDLTKICWEQWLSANRNKVAAERVARAAVLAQNEKHRPVEAVVKIQSALFHKGEL